MVLGMDQQFNVTIRDQSHVNGTVHLLVISKITLQMYLIISDHEDL